MMTIRRTFGMRKATKYIETVPHTNTLHIRSGRGIEHDIIRDSRLGIDQQIHALFRGIRAEGIIDCNYAPILHFIPLFHLRNGGLHHGDLVPFLNHRQFNQAMRTISLPDEKDYKAYTDEGDTHLSRRALRDQPNEIIDCEYQKCQKTESAYIQRLQEQLKIRQRIADIPPREAHLTKVLQEFKTYEKADKADVAQLWRMMPDAIKREKDHPIIKGKEQPNPDQSRPCHRTDPIENQHYLHEAKDQCSDNRLTRLTLPSVYPPQKREKRRKDSPAEI